MRWGITFRRSDSHTPHMSRKWEFAKRALAALAFAAFASAFASDASAQPRRFGVIEIGGSGVKASVVDIVTTRDADGAEALDLTLVHSYATENLNPVYPEQTAPVAAAAARLVQDMTVRHDLTPLRIYIVGTSGLADLPHRAPLARAIDAAVAGRAGAMHVVSSAEQARLSFDGVVNCERLAARRRDVVFIDVASAETTAAVAVDAAGPCGAESIATTGFAFGVKSVARAAGAENVDTLIRAPMESAFASAPRQFMESPRVYLGGGVVWALATFAHPGDGRRYVPLDARDIERLRAQLASDPLCITDPTMAQRRDRACRFLDVDLSAIGDVEQRVRANADHREIVASIYTLDQLRVGAEILATLSERLRLSRRQLFFARPAERAWMLGFLLAQETGARSSIATPASDPEGPQSDARQDPTDAP